MIAARGLLAGAAGALATAAADRAEAAFLGRPPVYARRGWRRLASR